MNQSMPCLSSTTSYICTYIHVPMLQFFLYFIYMCIKYTHHQEYENSCFPLCISTKQHTQTETGLCLPKYTLIPMCVHTANTPICTRHGRDTCNSYSCTLKKIHEKREFRYAYMHVHLIFSTFLMLYYHTNHTHTHTHTHTPHTHTHTHVYVHIYVYSCTYIYIYMHMYLGKKKLV